MSDEINEEKDLSVEEIEEEDNFYIDEGLDEINELEDENQMDIDDQIQIEYVEQSKININKDYHKEFETFKAKGEIYSIDLSNNGMLVIGDSCETTYFYDVIKKETIKEEVINTDSISSVKFSFDNKYLVTTGLEGKVNIYETTEYKLIDSISGLCNDINVIHY